MSKQTKEREYLNLLIEKFQVYQVDFLNYIICKEDPLSYHHIIPQRKGGETSFENGVPLTLSSHAFLHEIERKDYITFKQITRMFVELKLTMLPPTGEYFEQVEYFKNKYNKHLIRTYKK